MFRDYVRATKHLVGPPGGLSMHDAAAGLLQGRIRQAARELDTDIDGVVSRIVELALARFERRPAPIYVVGIGGSGSRWLTGMLAETLPAIDLEEASTPADLGAKIESMPADEQGFVIDCLHLGHASPAFAHTPFEHLVAAQVVNSAIPVIEPRHKIWDPESFAVYLLRDPREQVTCFALRKPGFKQRASPASNDEQFLAICAGWNANNYSRMRRSSVRPDFVCRYEELEASASKVLERLVAAMGRPAIAGAAARAAQKYDSSSMRSGALPHRGSLSTFDHGDWREETDERQKLVLHSYLTEAVTAAGYPADDCLGRPLSLRASRDARRLSFDGGGDLGVLFVREPNAGPGASWTRLGEAHGVIEVGPEIELKLRVHEQASSTSIRLLCDMPADSLDSLCMAGNTSIDDELLSICTASLRDLRELDLARTAITNSCVRSIALLTQLAGVNIFEAKLTPDGISALKEALPPSTAIGS